VKIVIKGANGDELSFEETGGDTVTVALVQTGNRVDVAGTFKKQELFEAVEWLRRKPNNWHQPTVRGGATE
jgi:hypothetical protein